MFYVGVLRKRESCHKGSNYLQKTVTLHNISYKYFMKRTLLVCFCKSVSWNSITDAAMIQLVLNCNQTRLNVSKTVLRSVLRKTHHKKLIVAGQIPGTIVSLVSGDACVEVSTRYKRHKLSKYDFSCEHRQTDQLVSPKLRFKSCTRKNLCN